MINRIFFFGLFFIGCYSPGWAQQYLAEMQLDSTIRYGKLENGVSYYIKPVEEHNSPLKMRFYVKVGTSYQEHDETNFAHAIEHLAFRETINFPEGLAYNDELLESISMNSRDLDGGTTAKFTKYYFDSPPGNSTAVEIGLRWFKDIATGIMISKKSVEREKGVLLQEFGLGDIKNDLDKVESSLYSDLFPCQQNIENFIKDTQNISSKELKNFYRRWYHPGAFVISIIGSIEDLDNLEKEIKNTFNEIPPLKGPITGPECQKVFFESPPQFSVKKFKNQEKGIEEGSKIFIFFRDPWEKKDFRINYDIHHLISNELMSYILNQRLKSLSEKYLSFYKSSATSAHRRAFPSAIRIVIDVDKEREKQAIKDVIHLLNQTKTYGVTKKELEEAKLQYVKSKNMFLGHGSSYWEKEIDKIVERQESLPADKAKNLREWLTNLEVEEFNRRLKEVISERPQDIGLIIPENYETPLESEKILRDLILSSFKGNVEPLVLMNTPSQLLDSKLLKPTGYKEVNSDISDSQTFVLENGIKVIFKPVDLVGKDIYLHGFSPHGASCFSKNDLFTAVYAPSIVKSSGFKDLNRFELQKYLSSTTTLKTGITPYILLNEAGIKGSARLEEFEDLLQLIYLYISDPRKDSLAFEHWKKETLEYALRRGDRSDFSAAKQIFIRDFTAFPIASEEIKAVNFEKAHEFHNRLFQNPESFTFVITGNFRVSEILPHISKYLGNIVASTAEKKCSKRTHENLELQFGPQFNEIQSPTDKTEHSYYSLTYLKAAKSYELKEELKVEVLAAVTQQMIKNLRAEGFSLYYFGVGGKLNYPLKRYEIHFNFTLVPKEFALIRKRSFEIIDQIKANNLPEGVFSIAIQAVQGMYNIKRLGHPKRQQEIIYHHERYQKPVVDPLEVDGYIKALTEKDIADFAKNFYQDEYQYELLMK